MKESIARAMLATVLACGASGAALADGGCGMNSNKPCPPAKSSSKEPAYQSLNSNKSTTQQAGEAPARTSVQSRETGASAAKATLSGVSASDLKKPPQGECGMNSNKPCADQGDTAVPARVQAGDEGESAAKATLSGVNPSDLKIKPKSTSTFEKEPAAKP